jgi:hypothetical protein
VSSAAAQGSQTVEDYRELLAALAHAGFEVVVIGGCAVGAYARLVGETVVSGDLDVLVSQRTLEALVMEAKSLNLEIQKLPVPRSLPVAVFHWRGLEVNALTESSGLGAADVEANMAREFLVGGDTAILMVDPFELLRNKLAIRREKDLPHIDVLRRFLDEEIVAAFASEDSPRARIAPAERLLVVLGTSTLEDDLSERLLPLARELPDFRFLAHRLPSASLVERLRALTPSADIRAKVDGIARARGFSAP